MALGGIAGNSASSGDWAIVVPPRDRMAALPKVPSSSTPDSSTPTPRDGRKHATDRNSALIAGPVAVFGRPLRQHYPVIVDQQMAIRNSDADGAGLQRGPVGGFRGGQWSVAVQDARQHAGRSGWQVQRHQKGIRQVRRQTRDETGQRLDAAGGSTDGNHVELIVFDRH